MAKGKYGVYFAYNLQPFAARGSKLLVLIAESNKVRSEMAKQKRDWQQAPIIIATGRRAGRPSLPVGSKSKSREGYILVKVDEFTWEREHRIMAQKALGKDLPFDAIVAHVNQRKDDNTPSNLLICTDEYLRELRVRQRVKEMGLDPFQFTIKNGLVEFCGPE